jgi:hypothetical protein
VNKYQKFTGLLLAFAVMLTSPGLSLGSDSDWILGKWELVYDPDGSAKDYLEFFENGDVISHGPAGENTGIYVVNPGSVKAVISIKDKDVIFTFFYNDAKTQLRIITSHTGRESVYEKLE